MYWCEYKSPIKYNACEKNSVWNPRRCASEINKYLKCIANDLVIKCDGVIDVVAAPYDKRTSFTEKK